MGLFCKDGGYAKIDVKVKLISFEIILINSGNNYCKTCYNRLTREVIATPAGETKFATKSIELIKNLKANQTNVNLLVNVINKDSEKIVKKDKRELRLGTFVIKDKSGQINLTLWNNIIDMIKDGDVIYIESGFVREWNNTNRITLGKNGKIKKIN